MCLQPGDVFVTKIYPTSGLWMKTLAPSVLSTIAMPETCTGCCRSSLIGLVMNIKFVWLVHTFLKFTNVVSGEKNQQSKFRDFTVESEHWTKTSKPELTFDCHQSFDGVVVHVQMMHLYRSIIVPRRKVRPADSRSASCTE